MARGGPCAGLSLRSDDRALSGACVRLERRAVKVACVVLRGLGGCEPTWIPGGNFPRNFCYNPGPMPRKIRELIRDLERAGFVNRGGKGDHRNFVHPKVPKPVTISGKTGDDARDYQEKDAQRAIEESKK